MRAAEYDRFSDAAHRAVVLAERGAREAGHEVVGTEHLLVALAEQDDEVQERLATVGVSAHSLRERVSEWSHRAAPLPRAVFSPSLRRTVHLAGRLASQERSQVVSGRHLLTALLEVEDEFVLRVLIGLGVDPGALRRRTAARSSSGQGSPGPSGLGSSGPSGSSGSSAATVPAPATPALAGAELVAAPRRRGLLNSVLGRR